MHRQIAGKLTGRVTKWLVLVFWIIAFIGLGSLSSKLADVQNNEASSWLPGSAESTEVSNELASTVDPNDIPTLVIYSKSSGLTDEDKAQIEQQAEAMGSIDGVVEGTVLTPSQAAQRRAVA